MSTIESGAARLVPATPLEFSRYAKNLSWLLEVPLRFAQDLLADLYGFGSLQELKSVLPTPDESDRSTGPFDSPRLRPSYFLNGVRTEEPNSLSPLSLRERKLLHCSMRVMYERPEQEGRLRRRHYAVLDAAFFSEPSVHHKCFADVKRGIQAMEGTPLEKETYLEMNWPPAFWSYLEATQLMHFDASEGLREIAKSSVYFKESAILSMGDMFQSTAAYRAPEIFLQMAGETPEPSPEFAFFGNDCEFFEDLPSINNCNPGLFEVYNNGFWEHMSDAMPPDFFDKLPEEILELNVEEIIALPPKEFPELISAARKWRLHQLRLQCADYVACEYKNRWFSKTEEMFWPGSAGNTVIEKSEFVLEISRNDASLNLYAEFAEVNRSENEDLNCQMFKFKTLLTRTAPGEAEDVVGYIIGWLVDPTLEQYVCDQEEINFYSESDPMLEDGLNGFLNAYLAFNGHDSLVDFVNSRRTNSIVIAEVVLREKYRKKGLTQLAFTGLSSLFENAPHTDFPDGWKEFADFEIESDEDISDREPDLYINPPGVFLVPVARNNKRLRSYLISMSPEDGWFCGDEMLDVFPFHYTLHESTEEDN